MRAFQWPALPVIPLMPGQGGCSGVPHQDVIVSRWTDHPADDQQFSTQISMAEVVYNAIGGSSSSPEHDLAVPVMLFLAIRIQCHQTHLHRAPACMPGRGRAAYAWHHVCMAHHQEVGAEPHVSALCCNAQVWKVSPRACPFRTGQVNPTYPLSD